MSLASWKLNALTVLIFHQILPTSNIRNIRRTVRRICMCILRLKGLRRVRIFREDI